MSNSIQSPPPKAIRAHLIRSSSKVSHGPAANLTLKHSQSGVYSNSTLLPQISQRAPSNNTQTLQATLKANGESPNVRENQYQSVK